MTIEDVLIKLEDHKLTFNNELISMGTVEDSITIRYEHGLMIMSADFIVGIDNEYYEKKEKTD